MSDTDHNFELNTARSRITVKLTPSQQRLDIGTGKNRLILQTKIVKDVIQLVLSDDAKETFSGSFEELIDELGVIKALQGIKALIHIDKDKIQDEQTRRFCETIEFFMGQIQPAG